MNNRTDRDLLVDLWPKDVPITRVEDGRIFSPTTPKGVVAAWVVNTQYVFICAITPEESVNEPCEWWRKVILGNRDEIQATIRDAWATIQEGDDTTPVVEP